MVLKGSTRYIYTLRTKRNVVRVTIFGRETAYRQDNNHLLGFVILYIVHLALYEEDVFQA